MMMSNIGRLITDSYCNGYFGRLYDSEIEAEGPDWIVIRKPDGSCDFTGFTDPENTKQRLIDEWCK